MTTVRFSKSILGAINKNQLNIRSRFFHYVQGQSPERGIREYFYFIDHQGQLFLDDSKMKNFTSCFKEKAFLAFFFTRLKKNESGRFNEEFPFISPCGRERNFIRCDDQPIVFTHVLPTPTSDGSALLSYGGAQEMLTFQFEPEKICMLPSTGRVYHPAPEKTGGVGLIKSSLAIELSRDFDFENGDTQPPSHFTWKGKKYSLTNELLSAMEDRDV